MILLTVGVAHQVSEMISQARKMIFLTVEMMSQVCEMIFLTSFIVLSVSKTLLLGMGEMGSYLNVQKKLGDSRWKLGATSVERGVPGGSTRTG